jgi:leucyl aminopeptidase
MGEMKADMTGGATVANALLALAKRKAESNAVALVPLVENMCSGTATRPGDVYECTLLVACFLFFSSLLGTRP